MTDIGLRCYGKVEQDIQVLHLIISKPILYWDNLLMYYLKMITKIDWIENYWNAIYKMEKFNYDKLRSMIARCEWTFAKTMPFAPHEYIVKDKCPLTAASTQLPNWPLLHPESPTSWAINPHISFQPRSGYWNSASLICAPSEGKTSEQGVHACLLRPLRAEIWCFLYHFRGRHSGCRRFGNIYFMLIISYLRYITMMVCVSRFSVSAFQ